MTSIKQPTMPASEREYRWNSVVDNNCRVMEDAGALALAIGSLFEAYSSEDISEDVMTDAVVGGLAKGLLMAGLALQSSAEASRKRVEVELQGDVQ